MTTGIKNWSTTPGDNNSTAPNGFPEGMAPSQVNDSARQVMAEVREWYEDPTWIDFGHSGLTYVDGDTFRVTGDLTSVYVAGRPIRAIGTTPFTIYGVISSSSYDSTNTTVDVTWTSGSMDATLSEIALGIDPTNPTIPAGALAGLSSTGLGNIKFTGTFAFPDKSELTIASGAITITGPAHTVDTQSDASTDDLDTINGGSDGEIVVLSPENASRTVILKNGTGNITTPDGSDIELTGTQSAVILQYIAALSAWIVLSSPTPSVPRGHISGFVPSNDTDADHDINVTAGTCRDASDAATIKLTSAITKQIDASWASGDDAGGLSSSLTLSADTWYHIFAINVAGSADVGFDTDIDAANLIADHSATAYRRIGSVLTDGSSNIIAFTADETDGGGLDVFWTDPPLSVNAQAVSSSAATLTLDVPTGYKTKADVSFYMTGSTAIGYAFPTFVNSETPAKTSTPVGNVAGIRETQINIKADTSAQIKFTCASSETLYATTTGWNDSRR